MTRSITVAARGLAAAPRVAMSHNRRTVWRGSLREFVRANREAFDRCELARIARDLRGRGRANIGGGAAPLFTLRLVQA